MQQEPKLTREQIIEMHRVQADKYRQAQALLTELMDLNINLEAPIHAIYGFAYMAERKHQKEVETQSRAGKE